jgi:LysM repeat protein
MLHMTKKGVFLAWILGSLVILTACSAGSQTTPITTLTIAPPVNPYQSKTITPINPTATVLLPTDQPLIPTATPFSHSVQPGDTLYGIAIQYNISLDKLVSANPGVDTSLLSIGTELIIPFSEEDELSEPTPTPYQVPLTEPVCYSTKDGGIWCYLMIENTQNIVLENLSASFNLYNQEQELIQSVVAIPPLNTLFPDQKIPLAAFIKPAEEDQYRVTGTLLTALPSENTKPLTEITDYSIQYSQENKVAEISGIVEVLATEVDSNEIWIAAVAFKAGEPVGIRKWTSTKPVDPETSYAFEIQLYSLGPPIDQVLLLSELH